MAEIYKCLYMDKPKHKNPRSPHCSNPSSRITYVLLWMSTTLPLKRSRKSSCNSVCINPAKLFGCYMPFHRIGLPDIFTTANGLFFTRLARLFLHSNICANKGSGKKFAFKGAQLFAQFFFRHYRSTETHTEYTKDLSHNQFLRDERERA